MPVTELQAETYRERFRLLTVWLTHLNTLCAGSIVVIGSFATKNHVTGGVWAALAMATFGAAIVCGLLAHFFVAVQIGDAVPDEEFPAPAGANFLPKATIVGAVALFVLALLFLVVFGFMNLT